MRTRLDLLVISALALYRLWRLVAKDDITKRWREEIYNRWPPNAVRATGTMKWDQKKRENVFVARTERKDHPKVSLVAASISCLWCAVTFASAALTVAVDASFGLTWPLAWFGALACLVGLLGRVDGA